MKTEQTMRAEGRQILRAMDNYEPLTHSRKESQAQSTLDELNQEASK